MRTWFVAIASCLVCTCAGGGGVEYVPPDIEEAEQGLDAVGEQGADPTTTDSTTSEKPDAPAMTLLCRPCKTDDDCRTAGEGAGNRCVEEGPGGRSCGVACYTSLTCPEGYECVAPPVGSAFYAQCRPFGGKPCQCTLEFREIETICYVENAAGRCLGTRTCATACDAATPAPDECNGADDDCDGATDEDVEPTQCDIVNEHGTCQGVTSCNGGKLACQGPVPAVESCDGKDDDCDGYTDEEGAEGCKSFLEDGDGDGFAKDGAEARCLCAGDFPFTAVSWGDCDDASPFVNPAATEQCDGIDNDCDGTTDAPESPGCVLFYEDKDGDGWGSLSEPLCLCGPSGEYSADKTGDCDDSDVGLNPGAKETCDGVDQDCDGATDEGLEDCPPP